MFKLNLYDRKGKQLQLGDIVKISDGKRFTFFCELKYLEKEKVITPFHTFSFSSIEKVNEVPKGAKKSTEERYNIWFLDTEEDDNSAKDFTDYLMSWRECEDHLEKRCWRI